MEGTKLKYHEQTRERKRIIYGFIKKYYETATPRDVISGLHSAVENNGKLTAVLTDLTMIYNEHKSKQEAKIH